MMLLAYNCSILQESVAYAHVRYLLYYQSHHCDQTVNWKYLGVQNFTSLQPDRPEQRWLVTRTFIFSSLNLLLNSVLIISCILAFGESIRLKTNRELLKLINSWIKSHRKKSSEIVFRLFRTLCCCSCTDAGIRFDCLLFLFDRFF